MMENPSESGIYLDLPDGLPSSFPDRMTMERATHIIMEQLLGEEGVKSPLEISLSIVDDGEIRGLNREYRGKDRATDVLSFPQMDRIPKSLESLRDTRSGVREGQMVPDHPDHPEESDLNQTESDEEEFMDGDLFFPSPEGMDLLGDIVISYETCIRQAAEIGHSVHDEFLRLLVHGILHCFGYDHELSAEEDRIMRDKEDAILALLLSRGI